MAYLAPIHQPSSVRHALKLQFLEPDKDCLVVAKANRLEIFEQVPDGIALKHSQTVYGRITMLNKIRPESSSTDHLFVGIDRFLYFTLSWNSETKQVQTEKSYSDQSEKSARDSQTGERCHIDPSGKYLTLEMYEGVITVVPIIQSRPKRGGPVGEIGSLGEPVPARIPELFVRSSCFMENRVKERNEKPKFALLYEDNARNVRLRIRQVSYSPGLSNNTSDPSADLEYVSGLGDDDENLELGATYLIPVSSPAFGVIILGETSIWYYENFSKTLMRRPLREATIFVAWEQIDNQRYIFADEYGKLYLFMLEIEAPSGNIRGWKLDVLGEISKASVLVYLGGGRVFVGSHQGDSQLVQIKPQAIEIIQTLPNIAPILDFTIMDMGNRGGGSSNAGTEGNQQQQTQNEFSSGQARLVTGSGAFKDGSLRSVRSGVGLEDLGSLDKMANITNLFSLSSTSQSSASLNSTDILVVSFIDETRIFAFDSTGGVEELDSFKNFNLQEATLYAGSVLSQGDNMLLQITPSQVQLIDAESGMVKGSFCTQKPKTITAVSTNDSTVVISIDGSSLVALDLTGSSPLSTAAETTFGADQQVACVALSSSGQLCAVGFWGTSKITVFAVNADGQGFVVRDTADAAIEGMPVPRSLLIAQILPRDQHSPTLFVAMADGNVITYSLNTTTGQLSNKKGVILGTQQAEFRALPRSDGLVNVFATCEHPSLVYGSQGRIVFSAITAEKATAICPFDSKFYPGAIAIATSDELKIAMIDEEQSTHVQGLHVQETVRRIAHSTALKAFGLGTIKRTLRNGVEIMTSHFKLADEVMFNVQASFQLNQDELVESVMQCHLDEPSGGSSGQQQTSEKFVVGTSYVDDDSVGDGDESVRGRILVFEVTQDRQLKVLTEHNVKGACRCLAQVDGKIVAALIKTVVVYGLEYTTTPASSRPVLVKLASFRTSTAPIDLAITYPSPSSSAATTCEPKSHSSPTADTASSPEPFALIAIADLMKSVSLVGYYKPRTAGAPPTLREVARHFQTTWSTAVTSIGGQSENDHLLADAEGNLLLLKRDANAPTADDRRRLTVTAECHLGEVVNRIRRIDASVLPDAPAQPRAFLATVEGSIHLFALLNPAKQSLLMNLQSALAARLSSPGNVPFAMFRAFRNQVREEAEPFRFVDGELIERFLDLDAQEQLAVLEAAGEQTAEENLEQVRAVVEALRRLR